MTIDDLARLTFVIQHNPNCPSPWLIRLPGKSLAIDLKPYGDQLGFVRHETGDRLFFAKTFEEAASAALSSNDTSLLHQGKKLKPVNDGENRQSQSSLQIDDICHGIDDTGREDRGNELPVKLIHDDALSPPIPLNVRNFIGKVQGVCMGIAMSGSDHPNPDGALIELFNEAQAILFPPAANVSCRAPLCDCSMGAAERCGRPGGAADPTRAERDEARKALGVSETEIQSAIENVRWVMQNLPIDFAMRDECPIDMLMHAIGALSAVTILNLNEGST